MYITIEKRTFRGNTADGDGNNFYTDTKTKAELKM